MNRSIVAGAALVLGIAIASPMLAWSADPPGDRSAPLIPPMGQGPIAGPGMMGGMGGHDEMNEMGREGWHRRMMMHGMRMSPQQRCDERLARRAGMIAYTTTKLNLTAAQRPLWEKVQASLQDAGNKQRELCRTLKSREEREGETVLDRINRRLQFLSAHLQTLQQIQPAMQQFYESLTAEQKAIINHPFPHP